jgi:hypothetical protein
VTSCSTLALDPGTAETGWCLLREGQVLGAGVKPNAEILDMLREPIPVPVSLAIEMIASYGMAVGREVFETCVWIGRFQQAWRDPAAVRLVFRRDVKLHLCNSARAKDPNIWKALIDKFGGDSVAVGTKNHPGPLYGVKSHARSALAVAITATETCNPSPTGAPTP